MNLEQATNLIGRIFLARTDTKRVAFILWWLTNEVPPYFGITKIVSVLVLDGELYAIVSVLYVGCWAIVVC